MARPKKEENTLTVAAAEAISDGKGGFLAIGAKFTPVDEEAGENLKAKGLAK